MLCDWDRFSSDRTAMNFGSEFGYRCPKGGKKGHPLRAVTLKNVPYPYPHPATTPGPECLPRIIQRVHSRVRAAARRVLFECGGGGERERLVEEGARDRRAGGESK